MGEDPSTNSKRSVRFDAQFQQNPESAINRGCDLSFIGMRLIRIEEIFITVLVRFLFEDLSSTMIDVGRDLNQSASASSAKTSP